MIRRRIGVFIAECKGRSADPSDRGIREADRRRISSASKEKDQRKEEHFFHFGEFYPPGRSKAMEKNI